MTISETFLSEKRDAGRFGCSEGARVGSDSLGFDPALSPGWLTSVGGGEYSAGRGCGDRASTTKNDGFPFAFGHPLAHLHGSFRAAQTNGLEVRWPHRLKAYVP